VLHHTGCVTRQFHHGKFAAAALQSGLRPAGEIAQFEDAELAVFQVAGAKLTSSHADMNVTAGMLAERRGGNIPDPGNTSAAIS
jgi:hypothetical protein